MRLKIKDIVIANFSDLFEENLQKEICDYGILKTVTADKIILDVRTDIEFIPLIISGIVKVKRRDENGNSIFLYYLKAKQTSAIAITYAIENEKSDTRLISESAVKYIAVPTKVVISWFLKYSSWVAFYFKLNQQQEASLLENINSLAFDKLENRLVKYLEYTSFVINSKTINKKHYDISLDLNASRESVSRTLAKLEKDEVLTLGRNKIILN